MALAKFDVIEQYLDNNGLLLTGGFIYTYVASSSTPLATYANNDEPPTENANPVVLDASGRGDLWFTKGASYKVIIQDALGVTLKTIDKLLVDDTASLIETAVAALPAPGFEGAAFMATMWSDVDVLFTPIDSFVPTFDTVAIDTHDGLILSYDFGALANADDFDPDWSPGTVYVIPAGLGGVWQFEFQVFVYTTVEDALASYQLQVLRKDSTGQYKNEYRPTEDPDSWGFNSSRSVKIKATEQVAGFTVYTSHTFTVEAGDIMLAMISADNSITGANVGGIATYFKGHRVS